MVSWRKEKRSPATLAASSSSSNGVQNFFHDRCSDRPGFHGPFKGWLLTSRSASPDVPRSSGHLRTALNRGPDSSVTRLLLPLDCPSSSRRTQILTSILPITSAFRVHSTQSLPVMSAQAAPAKRQQGSRTPPRPLAKLRPSVLTFPPLPPSGQTSSCNTALTKIRCSRLRKRLVMSSRRPKSTSKPVHHLVSPLPLLLTSAAGVRSFYF